MKIIRNDIHTAHESLEFLIWNLTFYFCVVKIVRGHFPATFWQNFSDFSFNSASIDTNRMRAIRRGKKLWSKNRSKMDFTKAGFYEGWNTHAIYYPEIQSIKTIRFYLEQFVLCSLVQHNKYNVLICLFVSVHNCKFLCSIESCNFRLSVFYRNHQC